PTTGPVVWNSDSQTGNGSVTFNKTVYVGGPTQGNGVLSESAVLTGSDFALTGFSKAAAGGVTVVSDARVTLTIVKNVDHPLEDGSQTFTFHISKNGSEVTTASVTLGAGESTNSSTVGDLLPGTYTVSEDAAVGWTTDQDQTVTIELPSCGGALTF